MEPARAWLADRVIRRVTITWREDVRMWHLGQDWLWSPGGFGVFDPGINALSIATRILPRPFFVESAKIDVPRNRAAPIAARVEFRDTARTPISMDIEFRQEGRQSWNIAVETDAGTLTLADGGAVFFVTGQTPSTPVADLHGDHSFAGIVRARAGRIPSMAQGRREESLEEDRLVYKRSRAMMSASLGLLESPTSDGARHAAMRLAEAIEILDRDLERIVNGGGDRTSG